MNRNFTLTANLKKSNFLQFRFFKIGRIPRPGVHRLGRRGHFLVPEIPAIRSAGDSRSGSVPLPPVASEAVSAHFDVGAAVRLPPVASAERSIARPARAALVQSQFRVLMNADLF